MKDTYLKYVSVIFVQNALRQTENKARCEIPECITDLIFKPYSARSGNIGFCH